MLFPSFDELRGYIYIYFRFSMRPSQRDDNDRRVGKYFLQEGGYRGRTRGLATLRI